MCYKIGQRVRVNCIDSECHGWEGIVASGLVEGYDSDDGPFLGQKVDFPNDGYMAKCAWENDWPCFEPRELIPIDDDYDGQKLGEWELCPWQPSLPVTVNDGAA